MGKIPFNYNPETKFEDLSSAFMQSKIYEQARAKGWSTDPVWLMLSWAKEIFELWSLYEHKGKCEVWINEKQRTLLIERLTYIMAMEREPDNHKELSDLLDTLKSKTTDFDTQVAKEYGDTEYFGKQLPKIIAPNVNLDAAVKCVYDNNAVTAKKTYLAGQIKER